ncbi:hypothetical protein [Nonomuraea sp. NPDC049625]|uniref:hypothetical protein n=1 Tax=Nonomuraea sp. NPDC049625 TaxID=3155775 RepID=UPI00341E4FC6
MSASWYARMVWAAASMPGQSRNQSGPRVDVDLRKQLQQLAVEPEDPFDFFGDVPVQPAAYSPARRRL